jgi:hypothetical protein
VLLHTYANSWLACTYMYFATRHARHRQRRARLMHSVSISGLAAVRSIPCSSVIAAMNGRSHKTPSQISCSQCYHESHRRHVQSLVAPPSLALAIAGRAVRQTSIDRSLHRPILARAFLKPWRIDEAAALIAKVARLVEVAVFHSALALYRVKPRSQCLRLTHRTCQCREKRSEMYVLLFAARGLMQ